MISEIWIQRFLEGQKREKDHRSPYQRDRGRILHSEAFRCLQAKTQIHAVGENEFYRTRLTHSLEVAQIGNSLRAKLLNDLDSFQAVTSPQEFANFQHNLTALLPSRSLIESICYMHDIGHPPFGHGGETALNYKMRNHGGFEGNAQTFRIVTHLESYTPDTGMNLTRRALLGVLKYPAFLDETQPQQYTKVNDSRFINAHHFKTSKGVYRDDEKMFDWVLQPLSETDKQRFRSINYSADPFKPSKPIYKSLDCSIMELADDIAYAVHDLEDAIVVGMVTPRFWEYAEQKFQQCQSLWIKDFLPQMREKLFSYHRYERKDVIGSLVNYFITNVQWHLNDEFEEPLLRFNAILPSDVLEVLQVLKTFVLKFVIMDEKTQRVEYKGQRILMDIFDILSSEPLRLLPYYIRQQWKNTEESKRPRIICDYLASMSDRQAFRLYESL
ncbi:anti-phage deoxyguanosine triphosphatase [Phocoenobacter skyensis]|uniref:Deoxyguanosinetriphosphate triphosphohydrolase-like protein n=1 Tax=Phocoenobacter skyensis TaxID=97481 RepID=A0A1H7VCT6_9PAST|nr:anti-phage deoxyguanosine triphosphatase [Pasteurella skyensis]MDP8174397.1 anti-phage deoxyguanosine triphosphatase [Pasteurella skyensis]MDP8177568.1 anti-phage deoxyguanosine triphosphatase [Pasteurella skyensis]MDP8184335.1 anti-phage deoxyguanosine triphosphatase [Pasteurella skyensis]MDP8200164.1 anti-phage deoxyguanosine triphosphatase [Pasteurella skyensis]QLB23380.1 dGTPase [Pasteurella skyensis]